MKSIYKQPANRKEQLLFPPSIEEYVSSDNPVRVIDDFVELLDMQELGFTKANLKSTDGQPAYHPKLLLKIYIYGYLNKIRSSRKLELEIKRNIELMWLCAGLSPSYKTIANFRKENAKPLKRVFKEFIILCKNIDLISGDIVAVDGAFLRANASKNSLITKKSVVRDLEKIDAKIDEYLKSIEFIDSKEKKDKLLTPPKYSLNQMRIKREKISKDLDFLDNNNLTQYNKTDKDASLMKKPAHNLMAYNSQIVVDEKFKFIVATNISSKGNDTQLLHKMAKETKENLKIDKDTTLNIVADTGYYSAKELKKCKEDNINAIVPQANKQQVQKDKGKYSRDEFTYDKENDCYICPNNQKLKKRVKAAQIKDDKVNFIYTGASAICKACPLKDKCIPTKTPYKQIYRWEYEEIVEQHNKKMQTKEAKELIKQRGSIVEHIFGTIKRTLGWDHFLLRGKEKVEGENALIMFTYNFKRLLNLIGTTLFKKLIIAIKNGNLEEIKEEIRAYISSFMLYLLNITRFSFNIRVYYIR